MGTTDDFCYACGNLGFPDKKCPLCGREPTRKSMNFEFQDNTDFVKKIDYFGVPDMYRGIIWDGEILRHDKPELENDFVFDRFVKQLEKINAVFGLRDAIAKDKTIKDSGNCKEPPPKKYT